ncbi:cardioactive peptide [Andrena cerasifolii]|uniref:cardioactive peptide n=1 Tax=Andrena cerasifolii TaxID=2819439 RepID=UPI00403826A3
MKAINYVRCLLLVACLAQVARSERSRNKLQQQLLDVLTTDESLKVKRPFCNAFTGCGKKRNFQESSETQDLEASGSIRVPIPVYKALLRAATENIRSTMDRDANDYRLSDIPEVYLSGMPRKRLDVPATSFD